MIKQKLIEKRKALGWSQEEVAQKLGIEQSQYNRRENGKTKISKKEWNTLAKIMETNLEDIYEPEDGVYYVNNVESASGNYSGSHNFFNGSPDYMFETMRKYIVKLESEVAELKAQLEKKE